MHIQQSGANEDVFGKLILETGVAFALIAVGGSIGALTRNMLPILLLLIPAFLLLAGQFIRGTTEILWREWSTFDAP